VKDKGRDRPTIEESPDFAYFLGVILGDSSIYDDRIMFGAKDPEFRAKFVEIGKKIVGKEPRFSKYKIQVGHIEVCFYSPIFLHELRAWFNLNETSLGTVFGARSHNSDPQAYRRAFIKICGFIQKSRENAKAFIEGFYDSEGCLRMQKSTYTTKIGCKKTWRFPVVEFYNTDHSLLDLVQRVLKDFDVEGKIYLVAPCGYKHVSPQGTVIEYSKDYWVFRIYRKASVKSFFHYIHSCIPRKNLK